MMVTCLCLAIIPSCLYESLFVSVNTFVVIAINKMPQSKFVKHIYKISIKYNTIHFEHQWCIGVGVSTLVSDYIRLDAINPSFAVF